MAKKSRKDRKQAAAKQNTGKQNKTGQNVVVQAAEVKEKMESEKMETVKVETQEKEAVKAAEEVSGSAVEEVKVCEEAGKNCEAEAVCEAKEAECEVKEAMREAEAECEAKEAVETSDEAKKTEMSCEAETNKEEEEEAEAAFRNAERRAVYEKRFARHIDELKWLYMELYGNSSMFAELCDNLYRFYEERNDDLKKIDQNREARPDWYKQNDMLGMMFYIDNFAGNMKGVESKLEYLEKSNVNYIHLMPFLDTVEGRSDGGYAVADFRKVQEKLGTMEDLESLTAACHKKDINVCMDFVMNHTSEDHEWAKKARQGIGEYMSRYFFFDNYSIPAQYEKTVPQVFPTTAPGNFTWLPEVEH